MRVAYICADPGVPVFGRKGSSIHVQAVIQALIKRGASVELFATRFDGDLPPSLAGVKTHALPRAPKGDLAARERELLAANASLAVALGRAGRFELVYERYSLWSYAGMAHARATGAPGLLEVNAPLIEEQARHRGLHDRTGAAEVARRVFGAASRLLAVSEGVAAYLNEHDEARGRVEIVPNGVDPARFPANLSPSMPAPGVFTVGFVGTLKPWHGLETLLAAFARLHRAHPDTRLLIVGDGPERGSLERAAEAHGVAPAVHFAGALDPRDVPGALRSMDVAVAPYPALERFYFSPLKVYEYMAAGLPVVASRIGQLTELIRDGESGLLCAPGDALDLTVALARLRGDTTLRERLGRAGRDQVIRSHTWDAVAARVLALAEDSRPAPPPLMRAVSDTHR
jgi:glycosyltransferase involved in cell wall biosynthesis